MKFYKFSILSILAMLTATSGSAAQIAPGELLESLNVVDASLVKKGDMMNVAYQLDLSALNLKSDQRVTLVPWLVGENDSVALPAIVVNGRNAQIKYERNRKLQIEGAQVVKYSKGASQSFEGFAELPYQDWMEVSQLKLHEDLCGCGNSMGEASMPIGPLFDNRPAPEIVVTYIQPKVEERKAREEQGSAFIDYVVNKTNILPDYRSNRAEIEKIKATIDLVKNDPLVTITEINIHGFASPEGSYANNKRLAEGRARSLMNYVKSLYTIPDKVFTSSATPEDWDGLKKLVSASNLADKEAILKVIDSDMDPDAKDKALRTKFPKSYQVMLSEMYPSLRRSDYTVKYVVSPLTIKDTIEVMQRNPKNASLQEMFLVAQNYEPGSDEFNEVMRIAVTTYPDDPVANLNAALTSLRCGDLDAADKYLSKAGESGEAVQARGLLALKRGEFDKAERLLMAAKASGIKAAESNLLILARARQLAAQNQ